MIQVGGFVKIGLLTVIACATTPALAQQPDEAREPKEGTERVEAANQPTSMGQSPEMQEMACAMKSMADMCQMMMEREVRLRPYWMTAVGVTGTLLTVALVLFIVLEVQWIRFWSVRLKTERRNLG